MNTYYTGIGIARNLHRFGVPVYGLSSEIDAPGIRSRFFRRIYRVPNGRDEPQALCERLIELRNAHADAPVIFATRDVDVLFLHNYRCELSALYRFPQNVGLKCLLDKLELAKLARNEDILVPFTITCASREEIEAEIPRLRFPVVMKPRSASHWRQKAAWEAVGGRKAFLVESPDQLRTEYRRIAAVNPEVMIQEYVPGPDSEIAVCCCYINSKSELAAYFTARKLRQNPPLFGTGCAVETVSIPDIVPIAERLLRACAYNGLAEVEFKRNSSSGEWYLIEVNPRHWDQHELGAHLGVNLSWIAYREMTGHSLAPLRPPSRPATHFKWIAETEALMLILRNAYVRFQENRELSNSFKTRLRRHSNVVRAVLAETVFLLKGRKVFAVLDSRDPLPGILLCLRTARELCQIAARYTIGAWRTRQLPVD